MSAGEATGEPIGRAMLARALAILGLSALAVTQPVLDLFGSNPEFFVAGNYGDLQIVLFAIFVALLPPLIGIAITVAATLIDRRAGTITFAIVVGAFAAAVVLAVLRTAGVDLLAVVAVLAFAGGVGVAFVVVRTVGGQLLASYLAAANVIFVAMFLFTSRTSDLLAGGSAGALELPAVTAPDGPVVVILLDEFPAATIIRADGTVNADRYPGLAELASVSTWFRNASSPFNLTHRAVPALLDGRLGAEGILPTFADHPTNLFTLLGGVVPVAAYESVTAMCPDTVCDPPPHQPLTQALEDASIVYGHRVLPSSLRDGLPAIDNSWGAYGAQDDAGDAPASDGDESSETYIQQAYSRWRGLSTDERSPRGQAAILSERIAAITAEPALHFVHVAVPHRPWVLSRTGISTSFLPALIRDPADPQYAFENRMEYQMHSMQVGAADALIAELLDRLRGLPTWDDTLLVVTSDHGSNLTPPDLGRMRVTAANREEVYRIPLFIKAPEQTTGDIRDAPALTVDVLPSIVDLLDADVDWTFDGHSLYDGSDAPTPPKVSTDVDALFDIARRRAEDFPHGDDWTALAAVGEHGELIGRSVDEFDVGAASEFAAAIDQAAEFESLPTPSGQMPFAMSGRVSGPDEPPELVVAVNGRLAGVTGGYRRAGDEWEFLAFVGDVYRSGANQVDVYEVDRGPGPDVTLLPVRT